MKSKIESLLKDIRQKKEELFLEYSKLKQKYWYVIEQGRVRFEEEMRKRNKIYKISIFESIFSAQVREILSMPFIYVMIIPAIILDIFLFVYQQTALRLYKIPLVKRNDYIVFDRKQLDYLNIIQKINCLYCSYVNWLFSYAVEIAWRTEKYWCPIKAANKKKWGHDWEEYFADYWDPENFFKVMRNLKDFKEIENKKD